MKKIRLGIVGLGNMGRVHINNVQAGKVPGVEITAVSDAVAESLAGFPQYRGFATPEELFRSGEVDAVLIATPHYSHTSLGIAALEAGLHVMVEKPVSVHKGDAERLLAAHRNKQQVFAAMFNQRTNPGYRKIRQLIQGGELGRIQRVSWIVTEWFRPEAYYASGGWRATWEGEGGGVLLNQSPHQLDLLCWLFGLPRRVRAFCRFGRYHTIEVEDDVTAYLEFGDGATGTFITSTGESPGTNRLEISAERGRLVYENGKLSYQRNEVAVTEFSQTTTSVFGRPETWDVAIPVAGAGGSHSEVLQNFAEAILEGKPLLAPAHEGVQSVELANAMLLSTWSDHTIELPLDSAVYERALHERIAASTVKKNARAPFASSTDMNSSFGR